MGGGVGEKRSGVAGREGRSGDGDLDGGGGLGGRGGGDGEGGLEGRGVRRGDSSSGVRGVDSGCQGSLTISRSSSSSSTTTAFFLPLVDFGAAIFGGGEGSRGFVAFFFVEVVGAFCGTGRVMGALEVEDLFLVEVVVDVT